MLPQVSVPTVLKEIHNAPTGGHLGVTKTLEKAWRFYWVGQHQDVEDWCRDYTMYGSRKSPPKKHQAPMQVETAGRPMQRIAMLTSCLNKYVIVFFDYFTKWSEALPMADKEAVTVACLLVNEIICWFGVPDVLHTDQG